MQVKYLDEKQYSDGNEDVAGTMLGCAVWQGCPHSAHGLRF